MIFVRCLMLIMKLNLENNGVSLNNQGTCDTFQQLQCTFHNK